MKAKEYLLQMKKIDNLIRNKMAEIEQWKHIAIGTTSYMDGDRVQSQPNQQKMADAISKYLDIEKEIDEEIDKLIDVKKDVISAIEQLEPTEYDALHKIYVQNLQLQDLAEAYDKTYGWATTMHGRALADLQKVLDEREKHHV